MSPVGVFLLLSASLPDGYFSHGAAAIDVGDAVPASECATCHADIYVQWRNSRHSNAWRNSIFATEYKHRPHQWCQNCHAPTIAQQSVIASGGSAPDGVTCATCHIRAGEMYAQRRRPDSPHQTNEVASFGDAEFCGGCHEFNFPVLTDGVFSSHTDHPMQSTVAQFSESNYATQGGTCRDCHMTHRFAGAHDPAMLDRALDVRLCRIDSNTLRVRIDNVGAGHTVPTGDVHRHIVLRAWSSTEPERLYEAYVGRRFESDPAGGRRLLSDTGVPSGEWRDFDIERRWISRESSAPVNLLLRYVYTAAELPPRRRRPDEPTFFDMFRYRSRIDGLSPCTIVLSQESR
ncbi:MAG: multiheme c-type cytochrome [Myxococcota bacterium]